MIAVAQPLTDLKARLEATWMTGDYDRFSRYMEAGAREFYHRLELPRGTKLLDVGCGSGQLALIAAREGAQVTGCDIATNWLERARERAAAEGLPATFVKGDAEELPCAGAQFDAVVSLVGAMFAPRPERVAAEMLRVCRPGGMVAMANWTPGGLIGRMFRIVSRYIAPSGMPSPVSWGDAVTVRQRFTKAASIMTRLRLYRFDYPFGPETVVEFFRETYGPMSRAFASLDGAGQNLLRNELVELWSEGGTPGGDRTVADAEYLEVIVKAA